MYYIGFHGATVLVGFISVFASSMLVYGVLLVQHEGYQTYHCV